MYSSSSPVLSSLDRHSNGYSIGHHNHHQPLQLGLGAYESKAGAPCLKFKYFTTFLVSTTCLALLGASLATHKWLVARPIRVLKMNDTQTSMMYIDSPQLATRINKFQGEIYFGLFQGVKVLNYGFGPRTSVIQTLFAKDNQQEIINFKLWLATLASVIAAILFALTGSIFAIINFVMTPRSEALYWKVLFWNSAACLSCLIALVCWIFEYFVRLQTNVLTSEEVQNGWTSENRSHFGYSYYFVCLAFVLHLVNIFIISIVHFQSWSGKSAGDAGANGTNKMATKRQSRSVCEGVIMLY